VRDVITNFMIKWRRKQTLPFKKKRQQKGINCYRFQNQTCKIELRLFKLLFFNVDEKIINGGGSGV